MVKQIILPNANNEPVQALYEKELQRLKQPGALQQRLADIDNRDHLGNFRRTHQICPASRDFKKASLDGREACFPASVLGPVLLRELRRLASNCLMEVIGGLLQLLALFCHSDPVRFVDRVLPCFGRHRSLSVADGFAATGRVL
jgi:hypothetical protein